MGPIIFGSFRQAKDALRNVGLPAINLVRLVKGQEVLRQATQRLGSPKDETAARLKRIAKRGDYASL